MNKEEVKARIIQTGIIPAIRTPAADDALFAIEAVSHAGIGIVELTMTIPGALPLLTRIVRDNPGLVVGAGTVVDAGLARRCLDAGAAFLTSTGLELDTLEFALRNQVVAMPGALTPTEVISAWKAGADFVKVFPCSLAGGPAYLRALTAPLPLVPLIASGGVNQQTAGDYILAGATALGIGGNLMPREAVECRNAQWIAELTRRFLQMVAEARARRQQK
ncbi:bifunctional 4-hydroxy-2-oxoglutarate aldolase/2-dehydro-3-deoxy-phosphogluconate aldolase [Paludibaculum fermentans]|uniref:2-dehydro-3-deoxyphosphogluconate aldolase n=1 Tax=Paludibaculum fermentans TaxID=1473598 RepID=A0A7S7SMP8_PALFE|nr:2-dehydro-3-deoxyphosphogluconate aldolase [Paludibaculum fermentans]QOY91522.1 2-dehydro-3-deoxyphosphogluconate aldolase [Paludibaculum fermentans]